VHYHLVFFVLNSRVDGIDFPVTRFDWDFYFGTAIHRFALMRKLNQPLKIYGKGLQRKPFISLRDTVHSLLNAIDYQVEGHVIMNQTSGPLQIKEIAETIG